MGEGVRFLDAWTDNAGVRLHRLDNMEGADPALVPLLLIPGASGAAEDFLDLMEALAPRRSVAVSMRGRGRSDAPETGYSLDDHASDIEAVVGDLGLTGFCLFGHSRGVSYVVRFAARHPSVLSGLILAEYPAHHTELPPEWVDPFWESTFEGKPVSQRMPRHAVEALQRESAYLPLAEGLKRVACPSLILRGLQEGSLLPDSEAARYARNLRSVRVVEFEGSGHLLWEPDRPRFAATIGEFLRELDGSGSAVPR